MSIAAANGEVEVTRDSSAQVFSLTLHNVLQFTTGASMEPPLGFDPQPTITFQGESPLPSANTCTNTILLPTMHNNYEDFKYHIVFGIANAAGFGKV